ncbi:MAG: caspase family protein [Cyclobacteriaceae bacterium]|nr:caspase family protein [Cyclobacteriaceae bacterium]
MKQLCIILLLFSSTCTFAQNQKNYSDSAPVKLLIGEPKSPAISSTFGHRIEKRSISNALYLTVGFQKTSSDSSPTKLAIGTPDTNPTVIATPTERIVTNTIADKPSNIIEGSPKYYSLFIGIDKYQFASTDLPNLDKPLQDASALQKVLIDKYSLTVENSNLLENPTRAEVLSALEELSRKVTPKDNLLVFYAGHGVWDERLKVGYWLPSDSKINSKSNWLSNSTIRDYIAGINTKHTLLITDACFSGSIFKTRGVNANISGYGISKIYKLPSRKAMTSGTLTTVPDESKFMYYLIKRLQENTSKYLTTRQLFFSLETAVLNNTSTVPQLGVIQDTGDEGGDFIFIKR